MTDEQRAAIENASKQIVAQQQRPTPPSIAERLMRWKVVEESSTSSTTLYRVSISRTHSVRVHYTGAAYCIDHVADHEGCAEAVEAARSTMLADSLTDTGD